MLIWDMNRLENKQHLASVDCFPPTLHNFQFSNVFVEIIIWISGVGPCLHTCPFFFFVYILRPCTISCLLIGLPNSNSTFVFYETKVFIEGSLTSQTIPSPYSIYKINSPLRLHQLLSHYLQPQNPRMLQCQCSSKPSYLIQPSSFAQAIIY